MSKYAAFIAFPRRGDDEPGYRTGKLRVAKISTTPGTSIKTYTPEILTSHELKCFLRQLGYESATKDLDKSSLIEMLQEIFAGELNAPTLKEFAEETKELEAEERIQMAMDQFKSHQTILYVAPHENIKSVLLETKHQ